MWHKYAQWSLFCISQLLLGLGPALSCGFLGVIHQPLARTIFLPPLPFRSLSLGEKGLVKTSHVGLSIPTSLTLCTRSSVGFSIRFYLLQEEASLLWVE